MSDEFVRCVATGPGGHDLDVGKLYRVVAPEADDDSTYDIRVIDNEGEDYLYPRSWFEPAPAREPPRRAKKAPARKKTARPKPKRPSARPTRRRS